MVRSALGVLAIAYTLAHVPYLASALEDIDSVNFALGIRDFDVARHRPHPPGYPVYIGLGKIGASVLTMLGIGHSQSVVEARTLSLLSLLGAIACVFLLYRVMACWSSRASAEFADLITAPWRALDPRALGATGLTLACPLMWYLGVRPMSDVPGLAAALAAQAALTLAWWRQQGSASDGHRLSPDRMAASGRMIVLGSLLAGIAIGFRSQNAVLTLPLLAGVLFDRIGRGVAGALVGTCIALSVGALAWAIPLVVASGGLDGYLAALGSQAGEDFAGVEMLYLNPSPRLAAFAVMRTFLYPWDSLVLGSIVVALAAIGSIALLLRDRRGLTAIALVSVPYLVFHLAFQDTTFVRYALPLVPPTVYLAVCGLEATLRQAALPVAGGLALWSVASAVPVLTAYGREPSPTARVVAAMRDAHGENPGALAFHQTFQRPLEAEDVAIEPRLASPPRREWLELNRYWREGHSQPLWFLADPRRSDLALVDPRSRSSRMDFSWQFHSLSELGGMRPAAVSWYRMPPPGWFAEEGWALTPETAGIARLMGRGPSLGPITAWVRRRPEPVRMVVGGRHLGAPIDPPASFAITLDGRTVAQWSAMPGFFVHEFDVPAGGLVGDGALARLTIESHSGPTTVPTAIEQFDVQSRGSMMWAYDEGWQEAEYNMMLGVWRWTSDRSTLRIIDASTPVAITLRVERPTRYFDQHPIVRMKAGDRVLGETRFDQSDLWSVTVPLAALQSSNGRVVIETDQTFVPAERSGVTDRRRLGLRVFGVNVTAQP